MAFNTCTSSSSVHGGSCTYIDSEDSSIQSGDCKSCSLIATKEECVTDNRSSSCGWGEIRDICETIGNIEECNDMYVDGCTWDKDTEMCQLNTQRKVQGCIKCGDIKHKHTCNSLSNCFFDKDLTEEELQASGGNGICKSCYEAFPEESDSIPNSTPDCNTKSNGKCQFRNEQDSGKYRCRPVDPYPLIYEWIWYNRFLLLSICSKINDKKLSQVSIWLIYCINNNRCAGT